MSFLKALFGRRSGGNDNAAAAAKEIDHKGFMIRATPFKEGGQFQTCGTVSKDIAGVLKEHKFIRADRFSTLEEAVDFSLAKGRQIVDEQGDRVLG
jgi:hypothetical protein